MPTATQLHAGPAATFAPDAGRRHARARQHPSRVGRAAAIALLGLLPALGACDDMGGRQMPMNKPQPASGPGPDAAAASGQPRSGSASTLGKARDSAVKVGDKVDDYNRKIDEAAEEVGK